MEWPEAYIDWAKESKKELIQSLGLALSGLLGANPLLSLDVKALVKQAAQYSFELATNRQHFAGYFRDAAQFREWLTIIAWRELHRLLMAHADVRPYLDHLGAEERRLLGMMYLDRLPYGEIGRILGVDSNRAFELCRQAIEAFWDLLR
jgi:hypothetical protein